VFYEHCSVYGVGVGVAYISVSGCHRRVTEIVYVDIMADQPTEADIDRLQTRRGESVSDPNSPEEPRDVFVPTVHVYHSVTESRDNPFQEGGELAKKAEYIVSHSTIKRTELRISDPDLSHSDIGEDEILCKTENSTLHAAPPGYANGTPRDPVEVEVGLGRAEKAQPHTAEQVTIKPKQKTCQCCVVM